jgi:putative addiction module component (TIGR02574 family)
MLQDIKNEILNLKALDKIHLVEFIFDNLDKPDPKIEQEWIKESEMRFEAYKAGKMKGASITEAKKRLNRWK